MRFQQVERRPNFHRVDRAKLTLHDRVFQDSEGLQHAHSRIDRLRPTLEIFPAFVELPWLGQFDNC